ncbi:MAG: Heat shock protein 70 [Cyanobacteria bacterium RYN_339]|nr:Heat shock protein 70 [Cyanobacteria bacterium RYN_339]
MQKIAVDFGTSNTLIAEWNEAAQAPRTLRLPPYSAMAGEGGVSTIPSLLYVEDAAARRCQLGQQVRDGGFDVAGDKRFFAGFKRAIAADIHGFVPTLEGIEVGPRMAGELFLTQLLGSLPAAGHAPDEIIFTVPVQSFERYLDWLQGIAARLNIPNVRLVDESTAAALGYQVGMGSLVLVCDFGGGTLDLSLVRTPAPRQAGVSLRGGQEAGAAADRDRVAQVVAKAGVVLGGEDIDHWLVDDFLARQGLTPADLEDDLNQLKALAEQVKIKLSTQGSAELAFFHADGARTLRTSYARTDLEDILEAKDFYSKIQGALTQVLRQAEVKGVRREDIAHVLLVGGTTLIPSVQRSIRQNFSADRVRAHAPFEAVAHGALQLLKGLAVEDFLYHGYGIRYWDVRYQRHSYEPIFAPGHSYPTPEPVEIVLRASRPAQPAIELVIGEVEPVQGAASEVIFDGRRLVTTSLEAQGARVVALNDQDEAKTIAKLEPPGYPGVDRIKVHFRVDDQRRLRLTVLDLQTEEKLLDDVAVVDLR